MIVPKIRTFLLEWNTLSERVPARGHPNTIPIPTMVTMSPASLPLKS